MRATGTAKVGVMTSSSNLPANSPTRDLTTLAQRPGSLVTRGLITVCEMQTQQRTFGSEDKAERLFRLGIRYCYGEDGVQEDRDKARRYFLEASTLDHAEAQYELAILLQNGYGTDEESYEWLKRSADLGCGPALVALVEMNPEIRKEQKDDTIDRAREWYEFRANAGDPKYQMLYANFLGASEESIRWLIASAEQDHIPACKALGHRFLSGEASEDTSQQGIHWLSRAVALGNSHACRDLGDLYLHGHLESSKNDRSPRIPPDRNIAIAWYERGIAMGGAHIAFQLGTYYLDGQYLDRDFRLAEQWLLHAAKNGNGSARETLGREYASGTRLRQDADAAVHWLELATSWGGRAGLTLAAIHLDGEIVSKNIAEAIKCLELTIRGRLHRNEAMKLLAERGLDGRFSPIEEAIGRSWIARTVDLTLASVSDENKTIDHFCALDVAELYDLGLGVQRDRDKAIYWYKQCSDLDRSRRRLTELGVNWKASDAP
jgi:TPR repeat protein